MEITDASQVEAASYRYTPYGELTITRGGTTQTSDPLGQHLGFTARWHDEESGLTNFRARCQSATAGRFVQRDPIGYGQGASLMAYANSSPSNFSDPLGLLGQRIDHDPDQGGGGCGCPSRPPPVAAESARTPSLGLVPGIGLRCACSIRCISIPDCGEIEIEAEWVPCVEDACKKDCEAVRERSERAVQSIQLQFLIEGVSVFGIEFNGWKAPGVKSVKGKMSGCATKGVFISCFGTGSCGK